MRPGNLFIGRPVYWGLLGVLIAILAWLGFTQQHVRDFVPFQFAVLGLAAAAVAAVVLLYRPGERVTREPIEDDENASDSSDS